MTKSKTGTDKNLENTVSGLSHTPVTSHEAQQLQQEANDRRHLDVHNHRKETDMDPSH
ncbi:hypothetical protein GCM10008013_46260 [Paenibacillus segetis]|uniref:Uncharacterized protein n=2 Tax=Paenibacillus segetis TaxID=1325360 RepID=A0ABQ1YVC3_9BACL|nr:hypothetical protein GCM10008013_46260 [Paenibacillus segetis]